MSLRSLRNYDFHYDINTPFFHGKEHLKTLTEQRKILCSESSFKSGNFTLIVNGFSKDNHNVSDITCLILSCSPSLLLLHNFPPGSYLPYLKFYQSACCHFLETITTRRSITACLKYGSTLCDPCFSKHPTWVGEIILSVQRLWDIRGI